MLHSLSARPGSAWRGQEKWLLRVNSLVPAPASCYNCHFSPSSATICDCDNYGARLHYSGPAGRLQLPASNRYSQANSSENIGKLYGPCFRKKGPPKLGF